MSRGRGVEAAQEPSKLSETGSIPAARFSHSPIGAFTQLQPTAYLGGV
jgi:hypothetical protein